MSPSCCHSRVPRPTRLGRLIVKHKSAGYRAVAEAAPAVELEGEAIDTKKITKIESGDLGRSRRRTSRRA